MYQKINTNKQANGSCFGRLAVRRKIYTTNQNELKEVLRKKDLRSLLYQNEMR